MKLCATMITALGAATLIGAPALAQMQSGNSSSSMGTSGSMQSGSMGSSSMAPKMGKMQMKQMQKCQAMSSDMMAKNKTCAKMMKMHPEMMNSSGM